MNSSNTFEKKSVLFKNNFLISFLAIMFSIFMACDNQPKELRLNEIQVIGSHNSYKQAIQPELLQMISAQDSQIIHLAYEHLPILDQLSMGLRKLELDIYDDPEGERYVQPIGNKLLEESGILVSPFDSNGSLSDPGFKVFHVLDIDFRSHCLTLSDCLGEIAQWSDANPDHIPIVITINVKTDALDIPESIPPLPFTENSYRRLDAAFIKNLGQDRIIRPSYITKNNETLNQAVLGEGWPSIIDVAGMVLIVLDEPRKKIDTYMAATQKDQRIMFANLPPGHPESAFIIANDPIKQEKEISQWVKQGYLVRTRSDANTEEARNMDYSRFEAAKRSGAHYISTDYYYKTKDHPEFIIQFENEKFVRCNPITTGETCAQKSNNLELWDL